MTGGPPPAISVVVPTYDRPERLARLVSALEHQDLAVPFEAILVDNGSSPATAEALSALVPASGRVQVRVLRIEDNRGPAPARNLGWRAARAPVVAFTDDDCVPQPGWLRGLLAATEGADIVQGVTVANPGQTADGLFSWAPDTDASGRFETCNIAYRRSVLEALGGFDEGYHRRAGGAATWGDDTDLGLRALALGAIEGRAPGAVVWHDVKPGRLRDRLADLPRRAGVVQLLKAFPEHRAHLPHRWLAEPTHAWMAALPVVALMRREPRLRRSATLAGLVVLTAWARRRGSGVPRRRLPSVLAQWFVVDAAETAVLAGASLRHRTLYL